MTTEEDSPFSTLSIEEQCVHKSWKVRKSGYEEFMKQFVQFDEKAPEWIKYSEMLKKFVIDCNVAAQEKGLEATLVFIENSAIAGRVAEDVMAGLVTKCYGSPKAKINDMAIQITLMLIEIEKQNVVIEKLIKGMGHKFPKIVSTCIRVATLGINKFGSKVLNIKCLLKKLPSILEDKDKSIRDEAKLLAIEIYSWNGPTSIKAILANLKPVQIQELEAEFEKVNGNKPQPTRFLRSEKVPLSEKLTAFNGDVVLEKITDATDDLEEHIDSVNILSQLRSDFYEKLEANKWQERKEAIDMLEGLLINAPKLEGGDYWELVKALKKRITKDSNVIIVGVSAKCMSMLAKGLKNQFDTYASVCIPELLEKFKEKKQNVVLPLRDAVDAIYLSMTLESIKEDILKALRNKNPSVKAESVAFLTRCFTKCTPTILNKKLLKSFTTVLIKTLNESDPIIRDNSAEALGTAWKVVSEKNILPFLTSVDPIKLVKIKEAAVNVVITAKPSMSVEKPSILSHDVEKNETITIKKHAVNKNLTNPNGPSKTIASSKTKELKSVHAKEKKILSECLEVKSDDENANCKVDAQDVVLRVDINPLITDNLINELADKDWKVRSNALTKLRNIISEAKFITSELGGIREILNDRISDSNARLSSSAINLVEMISIAMGSSFKKYIKYYLPGVLNALGDPKTFKSQSALQCINTWAKVCGYRELFGGNILNAALKNTSVTLRSELWTWLADKLPTIPSKIIPGEELKCLLPLLYASLEDKNAGIRNGSERAVIGFMQHLGYASMYSACEKLKPMSVKLCKAKLDNERMNLPTSVVEKPKIVKSVSSVKSKGSKMTPSKTSTIINKKENVIPLATVAKGKKKEVDNRPLLQHNNLKHQRDIDEHKLKSLKWNFTTPRQEFIDQLREQMFTAGINKELITNMFHADFKYHLIAIDTLSKDLDKSDENNSALISNLDLILKWITLRFFDTNPSVLIKGLEYLQKIFDILTINEYILHDTEASSFVPYLVKKLGDPKDAVKTLVRAILNQIAFIYPNTKLFQYIMDGIKSKNSRQRSECLEHLTSMIKDYGTSICQPNVSAAFKEIVKSVGDRDKSVRTAALNCFVAAFFIHGDTLFKLVGNISEKDQDLLRERIERAPKNQVVPISTVQLTTKSVMPPVQLVHKVEEVINEEYNSYSDENNVLLNMSQELNHEPSPLNCSNDSPPESEINIFNKTEDILLEHSSIADVESSEIIYNKPPMKRFALDEKIMQELDAIVITAPQLILKPYHWNPDNDIINYQNILQQKSQSIPDKMFPSQPRLNLNSCSDTTYVKLPENFSTPFESIQQLINQIASQNVGISESAMQNLNEILRRPDIRSMLLENDTILSIFDAINGQLEILSKSSNDLSYRYKTIFNLCLSVCNYREFMLKLDKKNFLRLFSKLLNLLSIKELVDSSDIQQFFRCVNKLILNILVQSDHTLVTCSMLAMFYDTINHPQSYTICFKELLMKCLWKIVKDFESWDDGICYDSILAQIHRFLEKFYSKPRNNQSTDTPLQTCKTILFTMVKMQKDKVLKSLVDSKFPEESVMVVYIRQVMEYFNSKHTSKSCSECTC